MKCPVCNSTKQTTYKVIEDKSVAKPVRYVKCRCGLVFIPDPPMAELNRQYRSTYRKKIGKLQALKWLIPFSPYSAHLKYLKQKHLLGIKGDVLDIGSGSGRMLYLLKWRGWHVQGIEPNLIYAKFSRDVLKVPTTIKFIEQVKFRKKFDLIILMDVLEHIRDPIRFLNRIKTFLKEDGNLYIVVPPFRNSYLAVHHLFMYNKGTVKKLLAKAGFVVESEDFIFHKFGCIKLHIVAKKEH